MFRIFKSHRIKPKSHKAETFTDEEVIALEQKFIDIYLLGDSKVHPLKIIWKMYRPFWRELLLSLLFFVIKSLPTFVLPFVTANIINAVTYASGEEFWRQILINAGVALFFILLNLPTYRLHVHFHSHVVRKAEAGLRGAMVRKLQQLSITFHKEMQSGRIQQKLMRDAETVQTLSEQLFTQLPQLIISMIVSMVVVITNNLSIFFFFLLTIPAAVSIMFAFRRGIKSRNAKFRQDMEDTSASLMDMVEMTQITRAHALEETEIKKMTHSLGKVANTGYSLDLYQSVFVAAYWITFTIFQFLCLIFSAYMAYSGQILVGDISLYQSYFTTLTGYVSSFVGLIPLMTKGIESVYSISEILSSTSIENNEGKTQLTELRGEYEFRDVCFGYSEESPLIHGFNLHIKQGETIAIVGESGSGKSTLLNLVIGFNTVRSGEVLIDGININDIDLHSYRKHIAIVPQNSVLFTGTIRENITYGIPDASDEKIALAIEAANLTEFISTLPDGVDTALTEHGANLSGGQRQRLSIARAMIRGADVIILDEATSALDNVSEREIQNAISNLAKGRTTFIVAHRLSTIKNADRIAVLKSGVCVEIGSYDELMEKRGEFYNMQTAN